jgi:hypothetical protein
MKSTINALLPIAILMLSASSRADVLKLKDGVALKGVLVSANSAEIVFMKMDGARRTFPVGAVAGIEFVSLPPSVAARPAAAITIPVGTQITVRMVDAIDGKISQVGARYRGTIDDPVNVGSQTMIPRGAGCTIEVVSLASGQDMALRIREINVGGIAYSTSTEYAQIDAKGTSKTRSAVRRGVGLGALGAGIGAIAGGGSGAGIGAIVGGTVGAVSAAGAKGKQLNVPSETRLIFALKAPLSMN